MGSFSMVWLTRLRHDLLGHLRRQWVRRQICLRPTWPSDPLPASLGLKPRPLILQRAIRWRRARLPRRPHEPPTIRSGLSPSSSSALITPICYKPTRPARAKHPGHERGDSSWVVARRLAVDVVKVGADGASRCKRLQRRQQLRRVFGPVKNSVPSVMGMHKKLTHVAETTVKRRVHNQLHIY